MQWVVILLASCLLTSFMRNLPATSKARKLMMIIFAVYILCSEAPNEKLKFNKLVPNSLFTLHSGTSGIAPVRSGKCVYTEGVVNAQQDLEPENLHISPTCSYFDQRAWPPVKCAQRVWPHCSIAFTLGAGSLHAGRSSLMGLVSPVWSSSVCFGLRLHYKITQTESNCFDPEH